LINVSDFQKLKIGKTVMFAYAISILHMGINPEG